MLPLRPHSARSAGEAPELRRMKTTTTRNLALQCNFPRQLSIEYENYNNAVIYIYCRLFFFIVCLIFFFLPSFHAQWSATSGPQYVRPSSWRSGRLFRFWRRVKVTETRNHSACLFGNDGNKRLEWLMQLRSGCETSDDSTRCALIPGGFCSPQAKTNVSSSFFCHFNQRIKHFL